VTLEPAPEIGPVVPELITTCADADPVTRNPTITVATGRNDRQSLAGTAGKSVDMKKSSERLREENRGATQGGDIPPPIPDRPGNGRAISARW
jgi:hypothetical protein